VWFTKRSKKARRSWDGGWEFLCCCQARYAVVSRSFDDTNRVRADKEKCAASGVEIVPGSAIQKLAHTFRAADSSLVG